MRVKCLAQEHNTMSPARTRTRTTRSGVEHTNHEANAPDVLFITILTDHNNSQSGEHCAVGEEDALVDNPAVCSRGFVVGGSGYSGTLQGEYRLRFVKQHFMSVDLREGIGEYSEDEGLGGT